MVSTMAIDRVRSGHPGRLGWRLIRSSDQAGWLVGDLGRPDLMRSACYALAHALDTVTGGRRRLEINHLCTESGIFAAARSVDLRPRAAGEVSFSADTGFSLPAPRMTPSGRAAGCAPRTPAHAPYAAIVCGRGEIGADRYGEHRVDATALFDHLLGRRQRPQVVVYFDPATPVGLLAISRPATLPYCPLLFGYADEPGRALRLLVWHLPATAPGLTGEPPHDPPRVRHVPPRRRRLIDDCPECDRPRLARDHPDHEPVRLSLRGDTCACDRRPALDSAEPRPAPPDERSVHIVVKVQLDRTGESHPRRADERERPWREAPAFPTEQRREAQVTQVLDQLQHVELRTRGGSARPTSVAGAERDRSQPTTFAACDVLAAIAWILDEVREWLGRTAGRAVEAVVRVTGAPDPVAKLVGGIVEKAVASHLLRPVRSMARLVRLAGTGICAVEGRDLHKCRCAGDLADDLLKQFAREQTHAIAHSMFQELTAARTQLVLPPALRLPPPHGLAEATLPPHTPSPPAPAGPPDARPDGPADATSGASRAAFPDVPIVPGHPPDPYRSTEPPRPTDSTPPTHGGPSI
ncbi:hypothetical protein GCM10027575_35070 [Phytohabitans suffuscus]